MALRRVTSGSAEGGIAATTLGGTGRGLGRAATARGGTGAMAGATVAERVAERVGEREATGGDVDTVVRIGDATGADANGRTVAGFWSAMAVRSMLAGPADGSRATGATGVDSEAGAATVAEVSVVAVFASTARLCLEASISPGETTLRDWSQAQ